MGVVAVSRDVILRVGNRRNQPGRCVRERGDMAERVGDLNQFAQRIVRELRDAGRRVAVRRGRDCPSPKARFGNL